jgi:tripartite-type tricarboxylate transporter receptor subunit TctC
LIPQIDLPRVEYSGLFGRFSGHCIKGSNTMKLTTWTVKPSRRKFLHLVAGAAAMPFLPHVARAQTYPSRPVRLIAGFPAGSITDVMARFAAQWLSERFGPPYIVENRAGAASNLATEAVVRAPADGHTLLMINAANTINTALFDKLSFDFVRDIVPVASMARGPGVIALSPMFPVKSVPELIAYAKANPGKINFGAPTGTPAHVNGELFKIMAGVDLAHVPYRSTPQALTDLLGGQLQVGFADLPSSLEYIKAGRLRAIAVTSASRSTLLPDMPAVAEFLPGYEAIGWHGIGAPKNTPAEIVDKLNKEINARLADPKSKVQIAGTGYEPFATSPSEFARFVVAETEKWGKVVKFAGLKPD